MSLPTVTWEPNGDRAKVTVASDVATFPSFLEAHRHVHDLAMSLRAAEEQWLRSKLPELWEAEP